MKLCTIPFPEWIMRPAQGAPALKRPAVDRFMTTRSLQRVHIIALNRFKLCIIRAIAPVPRKGRTLGGLA